MTPLELKTALAKQADAQLAVQLIDEFVSIEEAFLLRKWKYTELNGGRFTEGSGAYRLFGRFGQPLAHQ